MSGIFELSLKLLSQLADASLRSLGLGLIAFVAIALTRARGAAAGHAVWTVVVAGMLSLPVCGPLLPPLPVTIRTARRSPVRNLRPADIPVALPAGTSKTSPGSPGSPRRPARWPAALAGMYLAVASALVLRLVAGYALSRRLLLRGEVLRHPRIEAAIMNVAAAQEMPDALPQLRACACVTVPLTIGWREPVIILPANWSSWDDWKLRAVLAHELAHIRRRDWLIAVAAGLNRCLFWFHPLAWWLERQLASLAEQASDDAALLSNGDAPRYAGAILEFASALQPGGSRLAQHSVAMARSCKVGRRIERVLQVRHPGAPILRKSAWLAIWGLALPMVYTAAAFQIKPEPAPEPRRVIGDTSGRPVISPAEARELEELLARDSEDLEARAKLMRYYLVNHMNRQRVENIYWMVEHHPEYPLPEGAAMSPEDSSINSQADYERIKGLWLAEAAAHPQDARVLGNAGQFLMESDPFAARDLLQRARRIEPSSYRWLERMTQLYTWALCRASVPPGSEGKSQSDPAFVGAVKTELESSRDGMLVGMVGQALAAEARPVEFGPNDTPEDRNLEAWAKDMKRARAEYAETLLKRAQSLDPANPGWMSSLAELRATYGGSAGASPPESGRLRVRVGAYVQEGNLVRRVEPEYPALARQARIQGIVRFNAIIGKDGHITSLTLLNGHPLLVPSAQDAVRQWVYRPTLLNGTPVEVATTVDVPFTLPPGGY